MMAAVRCCILVLAIAGANDAGPESLNVLDHLRANGKYVGIIYETWMSPIAKSIENVSSPLSVEKLLRSSDSTLTLADIRAQSTGPMNPDLLEDGFYYHYIPQTGPVCLYRKRPNETEGYFPDCANITHTAMVHAKQLVEAGIHFVIVDATNPTSAGSMTPPKCVGRSCEGDVLQLRPTEVLFEEWHALRAAGVATPDIAVWQHLDDVGTEINIMVERLLLNPKFAELALTDQATGKKVIFTPHSGQAPKQVSEEICESCHKQQSPAYTNRTIPIAGIK